MLCIDLLSYWIYAYDLSFRRKALNVIDRIVDRKRGDTRVGAKVRGAWSDDYGR